MSHTVLVFDYKAPTYNTDAGALDTFNTLCLLAELVEEVVFVSTKVYESEPPVLMELREIGVKAVCREINQIESLLSQLMQENITHVFIYRVTIAVHIAPIIRKLLPLAKIVFFTVDIHHLRLAREYKITGNRDTLEKSNQLKKIEEALIGYVDKSVVVSKYELKYLEIDCGIPNQKLVYLPIYRSIIDSPPKFQDRLGGIFIGSFRHPPNVDGLRWMVEKILPDFGRQERTFDTKVIGSNMPDAWKNNKIKHLKFLGYVDDIYTHLNFARLMIAPLRYGAGIKGKVIQSICAGTPVVCTSTAAEGLNLEDSGLIVCDSPLALAGAMLLVHNNQDFWELSQKKTLKYREKFSKQTFEEVISSQLLS